MRNFASTLVKFSKLSHIQTTIWRPPKMAPPRTAGSAGPFVTPLLREHNRWTEIWRRGAHQVRGIEQYYVSVINGPIGVYPDPPPALDKYPEFTIDDANQRHSNIA